MNTLKSFLWTYKNTTDRFEQPSQDLQYDHQRLLIQIGQEMLAKLARLNSENTLKSRFTQKSFKKKTYSHLALVASRQ